ncbi:MAG TPA: ribonuclease HII [Candidatus Competibacteraceae bacterium]|nr:ribonuclease HII [Candidatus Competibacteraceae bacterium]
MELNRSLILAGVDEAGRGPLAGPVMAAAVILDPVCPIAGLADSKALSARCRETLAAEIKAKALAWAVAAASVAEIDELNILHASLLAMQRAVAQLPVRPGRVQVDGNRCPTLDCPVEAVVKGDAKVARDAELARLDQAYPQYGFAQHKGYPTAAHLEALRRHGPCPEHRLSFAPVRQALKARGEMA